MPEQWKPGAEGKSGKANAETAGTRSDKANGSALREAGREAGKTKRVNSAGGWTADKSGKNDKRSGKGGTFGRRLHGGKGAAKGRRSGTARDHKRFGKKNRKSGRDARKQGGKKSGDRAGARNHKRGKRSAEGNLLREKAVAQNPFFSVVSFVKMGSYGFIIPSYFIKVGGAPIKWTGRGGTGRSQDAKKAEPGNGSALLWFCVG